MVKRLVELHDGSIRAMSAGAGKGARFTVTLPAIERPATALAAVKHASAPAGAQRILIVEDNRDARQTLAALLRLATHEVREAETGARGLALASAGEFDLAIIDIGLPDIDGYELARRLRESPSTRAMRLVAFTGYGMQEDRRRALAAGFDEHLAKPVDAERLEALLRASAAHKRARAG